MGASASDTPDSLVSSVSSNLRITPLSHVRASQTVSPETLYHRRVSPETIQQYNQVRSQKSPTWDNSHCLVWVSLHHRGSRLRQTISHEITMLQLSLAWDNPANNQFTPPQLSFVGWGHSYNLQRRSLVTKVMITLSTLTRMSGAVIISTLSALSLVSYFPWFQQ